ncbi:exonuclease 1 [Pancytospora philotis]|nr:exonuclease 1 [Pancytospora philotis]
MGISGLLPLVRPTMRRRHISCYKNQRLGVDGHVWLHGALSMVATDVFSAGITDKHVPLMLKRVKDLQSHGITPIIVFDGDPTISKEKTNAERRVQRQRLRDEAEFYLQRGNPSKARELMRRSISITPELLSLTLAGLRAAGVEYIVAPYEADPQLVLLEKIGYIDAIMTIDSDLITFGARRVLYNYNGAHVEEYSAERLPAAKDPFFARRICDICILSGCDYLDSIKGVGLQTAHKKLRELDTVEAFVTSMLAAGKAVPENYLEQFRKAKLAFTHHIVYNPISAVRQHLSPDAPAGCDFLGTIDKLPFTVKNHIGDDLRFDRHFKPALLGFLVADAEAPAVEAQAYEQGVIVDESLSSKYFN